MRTALITLIAFAIVLAVLGEESAKFTSSRAKKAQETYEKTLERLKTEYESKLQKAREDYQKSLEAALKDAKKDKSNKSEADRISKTIEELKAQSANLKRTSKPKPPEKIGGYAFTGGDGSSLKEALIIQGAEDSVGAVDAEGVWLKAHFPGYKKTKQGLLQENGKSYDRIDITLADGTTKMSIYFDITDCFGFPKK